jgi:hypothetical protein
MGLFDLVGWNGSEWILGLAGDTGARLSTFIFTNNAVRNQI